MAGAADRGEHREAAGAIAGNAGKRLPAITASA